MNMKKFFFDSQIEKLKSSLDYLDKFIELKKYKGVEWKAFNSRKDIFAEWMKCQIFIFENYELAGLPYERSQQVNDLLSVDQILKKYDMFPKAVFNYQFYYNFSLLIPKLPEKKQLILMAQIDYIIKGGFNNIEKYNPVYNIEFDGQQKFERLFACQLSKSKYIIFMVTVAKFPILAEKRLVKFEYKQSIVFLDIINNALFEKINTVKAAKQYYLYQTLKEFSQEKAYTINHQQIYLTSRNNEKCLFQLKIEDNNTLTTLYNFENHSLKIHEVKDFTNVLQANQQIFIQNRFWSENISKEVSNLYKFKNKRYILSDEETENTETLRKYDQDIGESLIDGILANLKDAEKLIQMLTNMKNLNIQITPEQLNVIGQSGNVVCLGRSGTGKTTITILRMFALNTIFRYRMARKMKKMNEKMKIEDIMDSVGGLRCIFVTASPVLTHQIKKHYDGLLQKLKEELQKRIEKTEFEKLLTDENSQQANEIVKFENYDNLKEMKPYDFPSFMTIRNLIMIIDGSLREPFFIRNSQGKLKGQTLQYSWHNEYKGTLYINNFYKYGNKNQQQQQINIQDLNPFQESDESSEDSSDEQIHGNNETYVRNKLEQLISKENKKKEDILLEKLKNTSKNKKLAYEVDFQYFKRFFWKKVQNKVINIKNFDVSFVWTQIYSHIKGHKDAHLTYNAIPKSTYKEENPHLLDLQVNVLYDILHEYEKWKDQEGCYDLMDVVNTLITRFKYESKNNIQKLHYIFVDEVQDLPSNILYLLKLISSHGMFYTGDTAQTITQGVGFRCGTLQSIFSEEGKYWQNISVKQLSINFRTHRQILTLANSIIDILQFFFSSTIDRLRKEQSPKEGPMPIIVGSEDLEALFWALTGEEKSEDSNIEFGCNQVVLVRSQEAKRRLPPQLQHALCLTIYESKGLEFDDVILFDFFTDSDIADQYGILRQIEYQSHDLDKQIHEQHLFEQQKEKQLLMEQMQDQRRLIFEEELKDQDERSKLQYIYDQKQRLKAFQLLENRSKQRQDRLQKINQTEATVQSDAYYAFQKPDNKIELIKIFLNKQFQNIQQNKDLAGLCIELKALYVAITRAKQRLLIYDRLPQNRSTIEKYWLKINAVELFDGSQLQQKFAQRTSEQDWKEQGNQMLKNGYYEQAIICFNKCEDKDMSQNALILCLAQQAKEEMQDIEKEQIYLEQGIMEYSNLSKKQREAIQEQLEQKRINAKAKFRQVGNYFMEQKKYEQAAKCYFSSSDYDKAGEAYKLIGNIRNAGELLYIENKYDEAGKIFLEQGDFMRAIECFDHLEDWKKILQIINENQKYIPKGQIESLNKRYASLLIEDLVNEVRDELENYDEDDYEHKTDFSVQQNNIVNSEVSQVSKIVLNNKNDSFSQTEQSKKHNNTTFIDQLTFDLDDNDEQIEEDEYEDEEDDKNEQIEEINEEEQEEQKQNNNQEEEKDEEFERIEQEPQQVQQEEKKQIINFTNDNISIQELSFDLIQQSQQEYDHLSNIDPQDQWLMNNNGQNNLIELISKSRSVKSSDCSEYSFVVDELIEENKEQEQQQLNKNVYQIKTKQNIKITNKQMLKLIELLKLLDDKEESFKQINEQNIDQLKPNIVNNILQKLDKLRVYRLCIYICNKYNLGQKIGNQIMNIAQKFSPYASECRVLSQKYISDIDYLRKCNEKNLIASIALSNILEIIHPSYLQFRMKGISDNQDNSFPISVYRGLLSLGLWKKILFLLNYDNALSLAYYFGDYYNYKLIFLSKAQKYQYKLAQIQSLYSSDNIPSFACLPFNNIPEDRYDIDFCIVCLEDVNQYMFKNFDEEEINTCKYPSFIQYSQLLWDQQNFENQKFWDLISTGLKKYSFRSLTSNMQQKVNSLEIYDFYNTMTYLLLLYEKSQFMRDSFMNVIDKTILFEINYFFKQLCTYGLIINKLRLINIESYQQIIKGVLTAFGIRMHANNEILKNFGCLRVCLNKENQEVIKYLTEKKLLENCFLIDLDIQSFTVLYQNIIPFIQDKIQNILKQIMQEKFSECNKFQKQIAQKNKYNEKIENIIYSFINVLELKALKHLNKVSTNKDQEQRKLAKLFQPDKQKQGISHIKLKMIKKGIFNCSKQNLQLTYFEKAIIFKKAIFLINSKQNTFQKKFKQCEIIILIFKLINCEEYIRTIRKNFKVDYVNELQQLHDEQSTFLQRAQRQLNILNLYVNMLKDSYIYKRINKQIIQLIIYWKYLILQSQTSQQQNNKKITQFLVIHKFNDYLYTKNDRLLIQLPLVQTQIENQLYQTQKLIIQYLNFIKQNEKPNVDKTITLTLLEDIIMLILANTSNINDELSDYLICNIQQIYRKLVPNHLKQNKKPKNLNLRQSIFYDLSQMKDLNTLDDHQKSHLLKYQPFKQIQIEFIEEEVNNQNKQQQIEQNFEKMKKSVISIQRKFRKSKTSYSSTQSQNPIQLTIQIFSGNYIYQEMVKQSEATNYMILEFYEAHQNYLENILSNYYSGVYEDAEEYNYLMNLLSEQHTRFEEYSRLEKSQQKDALYQMKIEKIKQETTYYDQVLDIWSKEQANKNRQQVKENDIFVQNKMKIAIKWSKLGLQQKASELAKNLDFNLKQKEVEKIKTNVIQKEKVQIGNKLKINQQQVQINNLSERKMQKKKKQEQIIQQKYNK